MKSMVATAAWIFMLLQTTGASEAEQAVAKEKTAVFVAGRASHRYGTHEHYAGCRLLAHGLQQAMPSFEVTVYQNGWPDDWTLLEAADTIVLYCDGGGGHLVNRRLKEIDRLMRKGVGLVCLHYAVEVPKDEPGQHMLRWLGGYFETHWSVNPTWAARFEKLPEHPITRGIRPFEITDEWYYHMRFRPQLEGVTPILTAHPPASTLRRRDGAHSGNPHVRRAIAAGEPQHVAWATQREDEGRAFGFTGGHFHWNWGDDNFRRLVLNAIVWTARAEVPADGVNDQTPTPQQLEANQDEEKPKDFSRPVGPGREL